MSARNFTKYHATKHPTAPTVTSIVPAMLVRVIGKLKNGSGVDPNSGKTSRSLNSHNIPPIRRTPNSMHAVNPAAFERLKNELLAENVPSEEVRKLAHLVASMTEEELFIIRRK